MWQAVPPAEGLARVAVEDCSGVAVCCSRGQVLPAKYAARAFIWSLDNPFATGPMTWRGLRGPALGERSCPGLVGEGEGDDRVAALVVELRVAAGAHDDELPPVDRAGLFGSGHERFVRAGRAAEGPAGCRSC